MNKKLIDELSSYDDDQIRELITLLVELKDSKYWESIKWYSALSQRQLQILISGIDPIKDPTSISRNQGMILGVRALMDFITQQIEKRNEEEKTEKEKNKESDPIN